MSRMGTRWLLLIVLLALVPSAPGEEPAPAVEGEAVAALAGEAELLEVLATAPEDLWSLEPIERRELPQVQRSAWTTGAIDRFILARLESDDFEPAPPATDIPATPP